MTPPLGMSSLEARAWARENKAMIWWRGPDLCWVLVRETDPAHPQSWRFSEARSDIECVLAHAQGRFELVKIRMDAETGIGHVESVDVSVILDAEGGDS